MQTEPTLTTLAKRKPPTGGFVFLINARAKAGLSQSVLAERCGLTQTQISRLEHGTHEPQFSWLTPMAQALGIDARDLADEVRKFFSPQ